MPIETIKENRGLRLCRDTGTGKYTVVDTTKEWQVMSAMPGDHPPTGRWVSRDTEAGIRYVAGWYSRSYAGRVYRELRSYRLD